MASLVFPNSDRSDAHLHRPSIGLDELASAYGFESHGLVRVGYSNAWLISA